ncbi:helix-turn-helix domain-containing protein [Pedococcus bigeumensis]|uniref:XRE family transcriptional regulator n=1 Tax=Pedococcus bigeumensis TaxID=433644 RepID=A0A502CZ06_9MICO|nr:helix-turn-helix transcriptional regulator [Pedococcus bigeumensis]TPG17056.1 XRE family transcriptional regulator [Pedococcus bigeumensis]
MTTCQFDDTKIRNAIQTSGMSLNEISFRVLMPAKTLQHIADGKAEPIDIRIDTLARLGDALGLPLRSLFAQPEPVPEPETRGASPQPGHDAATVIGALYDRGSTPTVSRDLAKGLRWDLQRLKAACDDAETRLAPAGLRMVRTHGEVSIVPTHDQTETRAAVTQALAESTGTTIPEDAYRAVYQAMTGQAILPGTTGFRRRLLLGAAAKLGMLDLKPRTPALSQAARDAFVEDPP